MIGLAFKLGAVPAHVCIPDVAEGTPAPSAAFLTTVPTIRRRAYAGAPADADSACSHGVAAIKRDARDRDRNPRQPRDARTEGRVSSDQLVSAFSTLPEGCEWLAVAVANTVVSYLYYLKVLSANYCAPVDAPLAVLGHWSAGAFAEHLCDRRTQVGGGVAADFGSSREADAETFLSG